MTLTGWRQRSAFSQRVYAFVAKTLDVHPNISRERPRLILDLLLVARDGPAVSEELRGLAGPWGQRVPWAMVGGDFAPMNDALGRSLPSFDVFSYRDPVRGRAFLGRTAEVERLNERIARGQATGVFGLRKVGKSSLVEAVIRAMDPVATDADGSSQKIGATPGTDMVAMWIDVQGIMVRTREALAERLAATLAQRLRELPPGTSVLEPQSPTPSTRVTTPGQGPTDPLDIFRNLLEELVLRRSRSLCIVFDEYDLLFEGYGGEASMPGVEHIFGLLRSLAQTTGRIAIVLIGRDPLFVAQPHLNGFTNPLLGWVEPFYVGPFSSVDAAMVLRRLSRRVCLDVDDITMEEALSWTGGHPSLLREYGSSLCGGSRTDAGRNTARGSHGPNEGTRPISWTRRGSHDLRGNRDPAPHALSGGPLVAVSDCHRAGGLPPERRVRWRQR